jgi:hypothetical protein
MLVFSTSDMPSSARMAATGLGGANFENRT